MANDNIFQQYLTPPKSVMDYAAQYDEADARKQTLAQNALSLAAGQQKMADSARDREADNVLSRLYASGASPDQIGIGLAQAGHGKAALAFTKQQQDLAKGKADVGHLNAQTGKLTAETEDIGVKQREAKRQKAISDIAAFTDPQQAATSLQLHIAAGDVDPQQGQMILQTIPQNPADFPKWQVGMLQRIMTADKAAGQIAPDANNIATNTRIKEEGIANRDVQVRGQNTQVQVQRMIGERQDRAAPAANPDGLLPDDTVKQMAQQYLAGDTSVMQNLGRGAQGAQNIIKIRKEITRQSTEAGMGGADLAAKNAEYFGTKAGQRTAGTRIANVEMAANEAQSLIPLAQQASAEVSRSGLLPFGKAQVMFDNQTNDPKLRQFAAANNALVNVYARAISPSGVPTVADKEHARELISTAIDHKSYMAVTEQMQKEITAARAAPKAVRKAFSDSVTGKDSHDPAPAPTGAKPSLKSIFGG